MKAYLKLFGLISLIGIITMCISCCMVKSFTGWIPPLFDLLPQDYTRHSFTASDGTRLIITGSTFCDMGDIGHLSITDSEGFEIYYGWMDAYSCSEATPRYKMHEKPGLIMLEDIDEKQIELLLDTQTNKLWMYQNEIDGGSTPELLEPIA